MQIVEILTDRTSVFWLCATATLVQFANQRRNVMDALAMEAVQYVPARRFEILLLDDDPIYRRKVARFAERRAMVVTLCKDVRDLRQSWFLCAPDVAIIDYSLDEDLLGVDVARLLGATPVLLISRSSVWLQNVSVNGGNIKQVFDKKYGVPRLLDTAIEVALKGLGC